MLHVASFLVLFPAFQCCMYVEKIREPGDEARLGCMHARIGQSLILATLQTSRCYPCALY